MLKSVKYYLIGCLSVTDSCHLGQLEMKVFDI
jgi:hypothetical protein